jgi:uncharacterized membrane protein
MSRIPSILLKALLLAGAVLLYVTSDTLPAQVASHFGIDGRANGYMPRAAYLWFMALLGLGVPVLIAVLNVVLPRLAPSLAGIPSRDYWLAPERRKATYASLAAIGATAACVVAVFAMAMHLLVVEANRRSPPRFDSDALWALLALLLVSVLVLPLFHWRRFRRAE